jgi:hypothetical protein
MKRPLSSVAKIIVLCGVLPLAVAHCGGSGDGGGRPGGSGAAAGDGSLGSSGDGTGGDDGTPGSGDAAGAGAGQALGAFSAGSRLAVRYYSASGAPDLFLDFYDQLLDTTCSFLPVANGDLYCLPELPRGVALLGYADADCEVAVYDVPPNCFDGELYVRQLVGDCRENYQVRQLQPLPEDFPLYQLGNGCTAAGMQTGSSRTFIADAVLAPSHFVAGNERELERDGKLTSSVIESSDGAVAPHRLLSAATDTECDREFSPEPSACRPTRRAWVDSTLFTDDQCTTEANLAYSAVPAACPIDFIVDGPDPEKYFQLGPEFTGDIWTSVGGCVPQSDAAWLVSVLELGQEVEASSLGMLSGVLQGNGQLQAKVIAEGAAPVLFTGGYRDKENGDCTPYAIGGKLHCLPTEYGHGLNKVNDSLTQYSDENCQQPLIYCKTGNCETELYYDAGDVDACTGDAVLSELKDLVELYEADVYAKDENEDCVGPTAPNSVWTWQSIDPASFPELKLEVTD